MNDWGREIQAALARWYSDTDGTLASGGTANVRTLTTNSSNAALADQSTLVFRSNLANTGATTLNVDGLGAKSLRIGGAALVGGELVADAIVIVAYNATDDAYDILGGYAHSTIGTLSVSGSTVTSTPHGTNIVLSAEDTGGTSQKILEGNPDGATDLYYDGTKAAATVSSGFEVRPSSGGDVQVDLVDASGTAIAQIRRVEASTRFQIWHRVDSEPLRLYGTNSGSSATVLFEGDPDGPATAYYAGSAKLATSNTGVTVTGTLNATSSVTVGGDATLVSSNNLSDVDSASTSRTNLGLGSMATRDVTVSTSDPSGGSNGDLWFKREA